MKRLVCLFLLLAMVFAIPAAAYSDIYDARTQSAVEILSGLDIVDGFPDGTFRPGEYLTRAQFCKLAVVATGSASVVDTYQYKTLYSDVTSKHWAAGYVNLASTQGIINGYGNGKFGPEDTVNYAQAVTMMLRILGYSTSDIGSFWPVDYTRFASQIGLDCGLGLGDESPVSRGDAAILLLQMLTTEKKDGSSFYSGLSEASTSTAILLDNNCTSTDGTTGCAKFYVIGSMSSGSSSAASAATLTGATSTGTDLNAGNSSAFGSADSSSSSSVAGGTSGNTSGTNTGSSDVGVGGGDTSVGTMPGGDMSGFPSGDFSGMPSMPGNSIEIVSNAAGSIVYCTQEKGVLSSSLIGCSGVLMVGEDDELLSFIPDGEYYDLISGVLMSASATSDEGIAGCAQIYTAFGTEFYRQSSNASSSDVGKNGLLLVSKTGYSIGFAADDTYDYDTVSSAILLDNDVTSNLGDKHSAMFYVNGSLKYYTQLTMLDDDLIGCSGTVISDSEGNVTSFAPDGDEYTLVSCAVLATSTQSDWGVNNCIMVVDHRGIEYFNQGTTFSTNIVGSAGTLILNKNDYAVAFASRENDASFDVEVLEDVYFICDDELDDWSDIGGDDFDRYRAVIYQPSSGNSSAGFMGSSSSSGSIKTYPIDYSLFRKWRGGNYGTAYIVEDELVYFDGEMCQVEFESVSSVSSTGSKLYYDNDSDYCKPSSSTPVISYDSDAEEMVTSTWSSVNNKIVGKDVAIYYDRDDLVLIVCYDELPSDSGSNDNDTNDEGNGGNGGIPGGPGTPGSSTNMGSDTIYV